MGRVPPRRGEEHLNHIRSGAREDPGKDGACIHSPREHIAKRVSRCPSARLLNAARSHLKPQDTPLRVLSGRRVQTPPVVKADLDEDRARTCEESEARLNLGFDMWEVNEAAPVERTWDIPSGLAFAAHHARA